MEWDLISVYLILIRILSSKKSFNLVEYREFTTRRLFERPLSLSYLPTISLGVVPLPGYQVTPIWILRSTASYGEYPLMCF